MKSAGRLLSRLSLVLIVLLLPLPRHWPILEQDFAGMYHELTNLSLYLGDCAILLFLASSILWLDWRKRPALEARPLSYPLALLWLWTALSALWAFDLLLTLQQVFRLLILLNLAWLVIRLNPKQQLVQVSAAITLVIQSAVAVGQFWRQDDLGLRWLGEPDLIAEPGGHSILFSGQDYWLRAYGLTPHPNILGGLLVLFILASLPALLQSPRRYRIVWLSVLLLAAVALLLSFSRAAWLGGTVGGAYFVLGIMLRAQWRQKYLRRLAAPGLAAALVLTAVTWQLSPLVLPRFQPGDNQPELRSLDERAVLFQAGQQVARINPVLGVGARNVVVAIFPFVVASSSYTPQPIHNMMLLISAELGIVGAGLWLWLSLLPPVFSLIQLRRGRLTLWAFALASALLAFAVIDLFDYYAWGWVQGQSLRWLFWGLWGAAVYRNAGR